ncbi:oxidoreductase [Vibrio porteresiae]|uniref:Oxidoreductase n=1 Tax=Vibrio porteresiae DSM 19223 TaxID=1123496 RepID=A0ABZ0Q9R8_9VIBR|nr:oxidoreductase [Vibrio porteresiae]WPC73194.1 oxidoreductase [Vibrio porteresiae DSM 19223]
MVHAHFSRWLLLSIATLFSTSLFAQAEDTVLTVTGIPKTQEFSLDQLIKNADEEIVTATPWTDGQTKFKGISAQKLLSLTGGSKSNLKVIALNNYWAVIPYADIEKYNPVFAVERNGEEMSVRDKGPIWVIYPLSKFDQVSNELLHSRMVWQVNRVELTQQTK